MSTSRAHRGKPLRRLAVNMVSACSLKARRLFSPVNSSVRAALLAMRCSISSSRRSRRSDCSACDSSRVARMTKAENARVVKASTRCSLLEPVSSPSVVGSSTRPMATSVMER